MAKELNKNEAKALMKAIAKTNSDMVKKKPKAKKKKWRQGGADVKKKKSKPRLEPKGYFPKEILEKYRAGEYDALIAEAKKKNAEKDKKSSK